MKHKALLTLVAIMPGASLALAQGPPSGNSQARVAQLATLASLTPQLCPDLAVNKKQVHEMLTKAGLSESDLLDPRDYGAEDQALARSAVRSFKADGPQFCAQMLHDLGPDAADLIRNLQ